MSIYPFATKTRLKKVALCALSLIFAQFAAPVIALSQLNGLAVYQELQKPLFIGAYYSPHPGTDPDRQLALNGGRSLELRVDGDRLSARKLNMLWIEGIAINAPSELLSDSAGALGEFGSLMNITLKSGDRLLIEELTAATRISLNGLELGSIKSRTLFDLILHCWLGSVPPSSDFREQLLVAGAIDPNLKARFDNLQPTNARVQALAKKFEEDKSGGEPAKSPAPPAIADAPIPAAATVAPEITPPELAIAAPATQAQQVQIDTSTIEADDAIESNDSVVNGAEVPAAAVDPVAGTTATSAGNEPEEEVVEMELDELLTEISVDVLVSRKEYFKNVLREVYAAVKYPQSALSRGYQGTVRFTLTVNREGDIVELEMIEGSPYSTLDKAAERALKKASPLPPLPDIIRGEQYSFSLPIAFRLNN